jgi:hypothetical protein
MVFKMYFFNLLLALFSFIQISAKEIEVRTSYGDNFIMDVTQDDTALDFLGQIEELMEPIPPYSTIEMSAFLNDQQKLTLELMVSAKGTENPIPKKASVSYRNYNSPLTKDEIKNITYIVTTLANTSIVKIPGLKSSLEKAGDKVDHVHPLKFLTCIYTDEKLKICVYNLMERGWLWRNFMKGLSTSLSEESKNGNLTAAFIHDFAEKVGIGVAVIIPAIEEHRWEDFVKLLSAHIPRQDNTDRYDM